MININEREGGEGQKEEWSFLTQASNEIEATIIESILDSEGIPVIKKYQEAGEYLKIYMGMTNYGVDIYVPSRLKEEARQALNKTDSEEE